MRRIESDSHATGNQRTGLFVSLRQSWHLFWGALSHRSVGDQVQNQWLGIPRFKGMIGRGDRNPEF